MNKIIAHFMYYAIAAIIVFLLGKIFPSSDGFGLNIIAIFLLSIISTFLLIWALIRLLITKDMQFLVITVIHLIALIIFAKFYGIY